jgi:polar amino acid transport system substrate-binding protein
MKSRPPRMMDSESGLFPAAVVCHGKAMMRWLLLLLPFFFCAACGKKPSNVLRVGMEMKYPPFEMKDAQDQPAGVSVDLSRALAAHLGQPVEFFDQPFDGLTAALNSGSIDVIISSMTVTPERNVDFSEPYLHTGLCLLVGAKSDIQSAADLDRAGRKVAVHKATTGHTWAAANLKNAEVLVLSNESAAALEVSQGKADAFIYDQMSTLRNHLKYPDTTRPLLKPFKEEGWGIAVKKGRPELVQKVNAFLQSYRKNGGFDALGEKWLKEQKAAFKERGVPFVF